MPASARLDSYAFKLCLLLLGLCCYFPVLMGQEVELPCGYDILPKPILDLKQQRTVEDFELNWQQFQTGSKTRSSKVVEIVPIVFHLIHDNGRGNISDQMVLLGLQYLNEAFANQAYYRRPDGVDVEIQFCLAKQDPNGFPTTGITRTSSPLTDVVAEVNGGMMKALAEWDPSCYMNVYVVNEVSSAIYGTAVLGYANDASVHGRPGDGIVIESNGLGSNQANTTTLIHEVGHYFNLKHTFEGGCRNNDCAIDGDRICDTPPDNSTINALCNDPINSCMTDAMSGFTMDVNDQLSNYMDYGNNFCKNQFTQGQKDRMKLTLQSLRASLLSCPSCQQACNTPFAVNILEDSLTSAIGFDYRLRFNPDPAVVTIRWYDGITPIGSSSDFLHRFTQEGKHNIILECTGSDPKCIFRDTICVEVYCPIPFSHNLANRNCIDSNEILFFMIFTNNPNLNIRWYVDDVLVNFGNNFNWDPKGPGEYKIYFKITNGTCSTQSLTYTYTIGCTEICNNEIDDDADGLIDGFDPDCCEDVNTHYFDPCDDSCPRDLKNAFNSIKNKWTSDIGLQWHEANTPMVGDMDGDGLPEIVGFASEYDLTTGQIFSGELLILDGKTGNIKSSLPLARHAFSGNLAIADLDRNGRGEIIVNKGTLRCYEYASNGRIQPKWQTVTPLNNLQQPSIADFNEDGIPEVYVLNGIFDGLTGRTLVPIDLTKNRGWVNLIFGPSASAAVDVLPDGYCPDCDGLELVVGNEVYSVNIDRLGINNRITLQVKGRDGLDGYTSIVDLDADGDLDAVVISSTINPDFSSVTALYAWEIQTNTMLSPLLLFPGFLNSITPPAVGDVSGDSIPEVFTNDRSQVYGFRYTAGVWRLMWSIPNNDRSGMSGLTLYDFDGDGRREIVIRDEQSLKIINGLTGAILYSTPCISMTGSDSPTIADIDGDREAELLCSCDKELKAFEPDPKAWTFTRPVMNQANYFNVNVNDDLTIPRVQQQHHLPENSIKHRLNSYLSQYAYKESEAADFFMRIKDKACEKDSFKLTLEICNLGPSDHHNTIYISLYDNNPFVVAANKLATIRLDSFILLKDSCITIPITVDHWLGSLFLVINDKGTRSTPFPFDENIAAQPIPECDYTNNLLRVDNFEQVVLPDLGPDRSMCDFSVQVLSINSTFKSYSWPDGSTDSIFTAFAPGIYWVEVTDDCGAVYRDSVKITIDPTTKIELGPDKLICLGDSLSLQVIGSEVSWSGSQSIICDSCNNIVLYPDSNATIQVTVKTKEGCYSYDTLRIEVIPVQITSDTMLLCKSDSFLIGNVWISTDTIIQDSIKKAMGCFDIHKRNIQFDQTVLDLGNTRQICAGDSVRVQVNGFTQYDWTSNPDISCLNCSDVVITPTQFPSVYYLEVTTANGCKLLDSVVIDALPFLTANKSITLCLGDSILIDNTWITQDGNYIDTVDVSNSCDSIYQIQVTFESNNLNIGNDITMCAGDSVVIQLTGFDRYQWNVSSDISCLTCANTVIKPSSSSTYVLQAFSTLGCVYSDSIRINIIPLVTQMIQQQICIGDSMLFGNRWISIPGKYTYQTQHTANCDTVLELDLTIYQDIFDIGTDKQLCIGESVDLFANGITNIRWTPNPFIACDTCQRITVNPNSDQLIIVHGIDGNGCGVMDSVRLTIVPAKFADTLIRICKGTGSVIIGGKIITEEGTYVDSLKTQSNCDSIISTRVAFYNPLNVALLDTIIVEPGQTYQLNATGDITSIQSITWNSNLSLSCVDCLEPILTATGDGVVYVQYISKDNCMSYDTLYVLIRAKDVNVYVPNAFSPNNDGVNNEFNVISADKNLEILDLSIYDRWGELLYRASNVRLANFNGWDGKTRGKAVQPGVYVYRIHVRMSNGEEKKLAGDITLFN